MAPAPLIMPLLRTSFTYCVYIAGTCSCQDCAASCGPPAPPIVPPPPWKVLGIDGWVFVAACTLALFIIAFGILLIWQLLVFSHVGEPMTIRGEHALHLVHTERVNCHSNNRKLMSEYSRNTLESVFKRYFCSFSK